MSTETLTSYNNSRVEEAGLKVEMLDAEIVSQRTASDTEYEAEVSGTIDVESKADIESSELSIIADEDSPGR